LLGPPENPAGAFPAFAHPASISQMGIGKLLDTRPHDEIGVLRDLALVGVAVAMKGDLGHPNQARSNCRSPCCTLGSAFSISLIGMSLAT
jgi:hypothetical protein